MFDWLNLHVLALVGVAVQFGGMGFFAFLFTPMVFKYLEKEEASKFLRQLFPSYYRINAGISIVPILLLLPGRSYSVEIATLAAVALIFIFSAKILVPVLNEAREDGNDKKFSLYHRVSVILHTLQFIAVTFVLIRLAQ